MRPKKIKIPTNELRKLGPVFPSTPSLDIPKAIKHMQNPQNMYSPISKYYSKVSMSL